MLQGQNSIHRRSFIGGSDARIVMGDDEASVLGIDLKCYRPRRSLVIWEMSDRNDRIELTAPCQSGIALFL